MSLLSEIYFQSMEPIPADELKAEKFPRISAEDLIELCELSGPSKAPTPAKSSKSAKPLIVVIDVRSDDEYPSCTDSGYETCHGNVFGDSVTLIKTLLILITM